MYFTAVKFNLFKISIDKTYTILRFLIITGRNSGPVEGGSSWVRLNNELQAFHHTMLLSACILTVEHCDFVAKAAENIWVYDTTVKSDVHRCS